MKVRDIKIQNTLKDYTINKQFLILLSLVLFGLDFALSRPLYVIVLDLAVIGNLLAMAMAFVIALLPKITAKLLASKQYLLVCIALLFGAGLIFFIYVGQYEVALQAANDPLSAILDDGVSGSETKSNRHIIATGLIALLYCISIFMSYLFHRDDKRGNPKAGRTYRASLLSQALSGNLNVLQARLDRKEKLCTNMAEAKVHKEIDACNETIFEQKKKITKENTNYNNQLAVLKNIEDQIKGYIENVYHKKSIFGRLKLQARQLFSSLRTKKISACAALLLTTSLIYGQKLHEYTVIRDISKSTNTCNFDVEPLFIKVVSALDLKQADKAVVFRTGFCGAGRIPEMKTARLNASQSIFGRSVSQRRQALSTFLVQVKTNLKSLGERKCDENETNIYRLLTHLSKEFDPKATSNTLVIFSDMAESSTIFEASNYRNNPSALMRNYKRIVEKFERDAPLPNLKGLDVIIINPLDSDYLLYLGRFWEKLLLSCGAASVKFKTDFQ